MGTRTSTCPALNELMISNVSEQLIEKGLATVLRHKRDDEDRSAELDKLIVAEQT
jgi:staphylococcal nuclease domain-containing protein 1